MRGIITTVIAVGALALWGCPPTQVGPPDGGNEPECESRTDCEPGQVCTAEGRCDGCRSSGECSLKEQCSPDTLLCALRDGWGSECATNDQCQAGAWCKQGLCVDRSEVSLCPAGRNDECPTGLRCNSINSVCEEDLGCADDLDCSAGEVCNKGSHACVPRCSVETQAEVCAPGEKCHEEKCVQCAADADCGPGLICDPAGKCASGARCYQDRDCKVPLVCHLQTGACLQKQPPCVSDDNCGPNQRCHVGTGKCIPRSCQPDPFEPNNELSKAFGVAATKYTKLTLCLNDVDYYSLNLARGDQLGVNLDADSFAEHTFSTVVQDSTGRTLAAGKLLTSYVASAPATYYVAISTTDPYQPYDVTFLLSRGTPCDDDGYEPNDKPSQATAVNTNLSLEGAICPQDMDHFSIPVPGAKGVKVSLVNYVAGNGLLRLCLFDGVTELGCSDDTHPVVSATDAVAGGKTVQARVVGSTERVANTYTLKVEFP